MQTFLKSSLITIIVVLYVISPLDFAPGPLDDLIFILFGHYLKQAQRLRDQHTG